MTDHEIWSAAVQQVLQEYQTLTPDVKRRVGEMTFAIRAAKKELQLQTLPAGVESICAECRGECCGHGKHHFTVVDLLSFITAERNLFTPVFNAGLCPYHEGSGCMMAAEFRPFNCLIFLCEKVDERFDEQVKARLASIEVELRSLYTSLEKLLGNRFANGLLISYERFLKNGAARLFNI